MIIQNEAFSPTPDSIAQISAVINVIRQTGAELPIWFDRFASAHLHRIAFDLALVRGEAPIGSRVLDVGSLPLMLTGALPKAGFRVTGLDIAPDRMAAAIAALSLDVTQCNVESDKLPLPDKHFDVVVFNEVFEHLRLNPIETVSELVRVMAIGGRLFLSTPNHLSYANVRRMLFKGRSMDSGVFDEFDKLRTYGAMGHVREYTSGDVVDFLERMGLRVDKLIHRGRYGTNLAQAAIRLRPGLRPFFSVIATRVA